MLQRTAQSLVACALTIGTVLIAGSALSQQKTIAIGTGGTGGVYYPLGGGLANLPIRMRTRWASVLVGPGSASVKEIASGSDGSRRSMERHFAKLGLPAPGSLLLRARVAHVLDRLDAGNCTLSHTAQEFGWRDVRSLRKSLRKWSGG